MLSVDLFRNLDSVISVFVSNSMLSGVQVGVWWMLSVDSLISFEIWPVFSVFVSNTMSSGTQVGVFNRDVLCYDLMIQL